MFSKRIFKIMTIIITTFYNISIITIIIISSNFVLIIDRRHAIIIANLIIQSRGTKKIIFIEHIIPKLGTNINCSKYILKHVILIKHSIPKLVAWHIISIITLIINSMNRTNGITIAIIIISKVEAKRDFQDYKK